MMVSLPEELHSRQVCYLHTDADLNYAYYVSTDNVLQLAKGKTDVVFAEGGLGGKPLKVAVIRYRTAADRTKALASFAKTIFSRKAVSQKDGTRLEEDAQGPVHRPASLRGPEGRAYARPLFRGEDRGALPAGAGHACEEPGHRGSKLGSSGEGEADHAGAAHRPTWHVHADHVRGVHLDATGRQRVGPAYPGRHSSNDAVRARPHPLGVGPGVGGGPLPAGAGLSVRRSRWVFNPAHSTCSPRTSPGAPP